MYITNDYARAIKIERKILIKAMFKAKERGLKAKVVNRNLIVEITTLITSRRILNHLNQIKLWINDLLVLLSNQVK